MAGRRCEPATAVLVLEHFGCCANLWALLEVKNDATRTRKDHSATQENQIKSILTIFNNQITTLEVKIRY